MQTAIKITFKKLILTVWVLSLWLCVLPFTASAEIELEVVRIGNEEEETFNENMEFVENHI